MLEEVLARRPIRIICMVILRDLSCRPSLLWVNQRTPLPERLRQLLEAFPFEIQVSELLCVLPVEMLSPMANGVVPMQPADVARERPLWSASGDAGAASGRG